MADQKSLVPWPSLPWAELNGELYLRGYAEGSELPYASEDLALYPIASPMVSVNRIFRAHGHRFIWDYETMRKALERTGFRDIAKVSFGEGRGAKLLIDTPFRRVESLYVEATA